jgi:hypothetical protein
VEEEAFIDVTEDDLSESTDFLLVTLEPDPVLVMERDD